MTYVDCIRYGDPCKVSVNGAVCGDCGIYADWQPDRGRWKVYIPTWLVPCTWRSKDDELLYWMGPMTLLQYDRDSFPVELQPLIARHLQFPAFRKAVESAQRERDADGPGPDEAAAQGS